ncbi:MAG: penicillin-binding protein 1B, partial [Thiotrichaceae bacterium]
QHVVTVWVGRDDNKPTSLTGGSGALRVWADMIRILPTKPFKPKKPKGIRWIKIDKDSGQLYNSRCGSPISLPFSKNNIPKRKRHCAPAPVIRPSTPSAPSRAAPSTDRPIWKGLGQ